MYRGLRIAIVIPAYNEERLIHGTLESIPSFVDEVIVVDDASRDNTTQVANRFPRERLHLLRHRRNVGVGGAIVSGYLKALEIGADIAVVIGADGQMDPADMPGLLNPLIEDEADFVKGNRFPYPGVFQIMPKTRFVGNLFLSMMTRLTSGYWFITDSQCGYTAIHRKALKAIPLDKLYPRYGFPNDLLAKLNAANLRVTQVTVRPIYNNGAHSGIRPMEVAFPLLYLLTRSYFNRLGHKYFKGRPAPVQNKKNTSWTSAS